MPYCLSCHEELGKPIPLPQPAEIVSLLGDVLTQISIYDSKVDALAVQIYAQMEKVDGIAHGGAATQEVTSRIQAQDAKLDELKTALSDNFESVKTALAEQPVGRIHDKLCSLEGFEDDLIEKMTDLLGYLHEHMDKINKTLTEQFQMMYSANRENSRATIDVLKKFVANRGRVDAIKTPSQQDTPSSKCNSDATGSTCTGGTPIHPSVDRALFSDLR